MTIDKYRFEQSEEFSELTERTLTELYSEFKEIEKKTIKNWVLSGATIKGGKIKLYTRKNE